MFRQGLVDRIAEQVEPEFEARLAITEDECVDLLHVRPLVTCDLEAMRAAMRFGFESGDAGGMLSRAVDRAALAESDIGNGSALDGLFIDELTERLMSITLDTRTLGVGRTTKKIRPSPHLVRLIKAPPKDPEDTRLRQGVFRALSDEGVADQLRRAFAHLVELRTLVDDRPIGNRASLPRKLEIMTVIRAAFEALARLDSQSALGRVARFAQDTLSTDAMVRLESLLSFESGAAELEVRVVLGYDGRVRDHEVLRFAPRDATPVVRSTWRRRWERFVRFFRGERFSEQEIIRRILDETFDELEDRILPLFSLIGHLEFYLAGLELKRVASDRGLSMCLPEILDEDVISTSDSEAHYDGLFNPLLLLLDDLTPVPTSLTTRDPSVVLITGPNSGGKTRLLQGVALAQLFGQAGLFVAAENARIPVAPKIFVSLQEGASEDHTEGRLGTELMRVRRLFEEVKPGCLVLLDELCSGTNPSEGIAIFELVLSLLPRVKPRAMLTTHFLDAAKELDSDHADLTCLQVELDENDNPTYQFVPGVANTSLAHAVAARLGVTEEALTALVERHF